MSGLQDLIDRERARDPAIVQILIVSPIGLPVLASGTEEIPGDERDQVMRRVFGSGGTITRLDVGPRLYTGRVLFDSSNAIMGAVILTIPDAADAALSPDGSGAFLVTLVGVVDDPYAA